MLMSDKERKFFNTLKNGGVEAVFEKYRTVEEIARQQAEMIRREIGRASCRERV